jgi:hypothetical protein
MHPSLDADQNPSYWNATPKYAWAKQYFYCYELRFHPYMGETSVSTTIGLNEVLKPVLRS